MAPVSSGARPIVTFTTDFGLADGWVAAMKGVVLGLAPEARLIDVTHAVPPQDVRAGAFVLGTTYPAFPAGTIHVAVVDPGVGGARRSVALAADGHVFVGPDNGLFTFALRRAAVAALPARVAVLDRAELQRTPVSRTFHGRDIFAPVAGHLAAGRSLDEVGSAAAPEGLARLRIASGTGRGEVLHVDRFGNLVTSLEAAPPGARVRLPGAGPAAAALPVVGTFGDVPAGEAAALLGSAGFLEIVVNQGNAAARFGARRGDPVELLG
jgi:S-adenosyl-L-methionine hydrolase (adenosine-forming)